MDCVFCKIAHGEIPSNTVYEDELVRAFYDLDPQAPVHILLIPKQHVESCASITEENSSIVAHIFEVAAQLAREKGLEDGFGLLPIREKMEDRRFRTCISTFWADVP